MSVLVRCCFLLATLFSVNAYEEARRAVAILTPRNSSQGDQSITGMIVFTETDYGVYITGHITGLPDENYGLQVHELGNILTCDTSGGLFNPEGTNHGGRDHKLRYVGDLRNITGDSNIYIMDHMLTLRGRNNVVGRTLVLQMEEDDLDLGRHADSLTTGKPGARVACGVIGIMFPVEPWNSAVTSTPSLLLFIAAALVACFRQINV